jgi:hypothetical protein
MARNARPVSLPVSLAPSGAPLRHRVADAVAGARLADHTPDELQVRRAILSDSDGPWVLLLGSGAEA